MTPDGLVRQAERRTTYGSVWHRSVAAVVDTVAVLGIALTAGFGVHVLALAQPASIGRLMHAVHASVLPHTPITSVAFPFCSWLYYTIAESSVLQATLGKRLLGLRVTDSRGNRISFARANRRYWSKTLSSMTLALGYLMAVFNPKHHTLHDAIAKTDVRSSG